MLSESPQETDKERLNEIKSLIPDSIGRYSFSALLTNSDLSPAKLSEKLWDFVWRGLVANDTFVALRKGIENRFKTTEASDQSIVGNKGGRGFRQNRRSAFKKWRGTIPIAGNWFLLPPIEQGGDLIDREERFKERVRVLLDRYGIIFRELLVRELPDFTWKNVFRSLRLMELSGEILAGYFFEGIPGPQFISHQAFRALQNDIPQNVVYWMNAADPASLCGVRLEGLRAALPNRVSTTHLVFKGDHLVLISQKNGKALEFLCDPDDDQLTDYFCVIKHLLYRQFKPLTRVTIETINGDPAARSPFADALSASFETLREHRNLVLHRKTF